MSEPLVLVFDLGGVIVPHDNPVLHRRLSSRCAPDWTPARIAEVTAHRDWGTGARPIQALHAHLRDAASYDGDWTAFAADWPCHLDLDFSMLAFVEDLAQRHRVMVFSNTDAVHWAHLLAVSEGRLGAFEAYLSFELGLIKPDAAAFEAVAAAAEVDPARLLFFDDVAANVAAAQASGWQAEVFVGEAQLRERLRAHGVIE